FPTNFGGLRYYWHHIFLNVIASPDRGDRTQAGGGAKRNPCKRCTSRLKPRQGRQNFCRTFGTWLMTATFYRGFASLHPCLCS
ncbi:MAG: hypothetical protein IKI83_09720, partial [Prevotella sp.]|nr:hypothetical protein [Prevotella sp.]